MNDRQMSAPVSEFDRLTDQYVAAGYRAEASADSSAPCAEGIGLVQVIDLHSPLHVERPWTHEHGANGERATQPYPESTPYRSSFPRRRLQGATTMLSTHGCHNGARRTAAQVAKGESRGSHRPAPTARPHVPVPQLRTADDDHFPRR
jgi:hypothetical protein